MKHILYNDLFKTRVLFRLSLSITLVASLILVISPVTSQASDVQPDEVPPTTPEETSDLGVTADWWSSIQEDITQTEYQVTWQEQTYLDDLQAAYQAPNRANNLRTYFAPQGPIVIPRTWAEEVSTPPWRVELELVGWGRDGTLVPASPATLQSVENRFEYQRGELVEWYRNDENGLEQGFILSTPPSLGEGKLQLDLMISGNLLPQLDGSGTTINFQNGNNEAVLSYSGLAAVDTSGQALTAWFALAGNTLSLFVDDVGATYPIEIDPVITSLPSSADWSKTYINNYAQFGFSAASAGDVNCDGYSDIIVGVPFYDNGEFNEGWAIVYPGSASGIDGSALWYKEGNQEGANFGFSVATAGDVDGNCYAEIIVGAPYYDYVDGDYSYPDAGAAWVYYGSEDGPEYSPGEYYRGGQEEANFGTSVAPAGDVNGDGYADIIIGAPFRWNEMSEQNEGMAFAYYGSEFGLSNTYSWYAEGEQDDASLGRSVATAGDVNNDGFADVIVGADSYDDPSEDEGKAFAWYGSGSGLNGGTSGTPDNASWSAQINQGDAWFGFSVSTAGDVNGDGFSDVIVGAPRYENGQVWEGAARLYLGSETGLEAGYDNHDEGNKDLAQFGYSVATAGDVNGDGYADVIVGAMHYTNGQDKEGRAWVWYGSADGISTSNDWNNEGNVVEALFGHSVATAGDVNGDGYSDIIIGAPGDATYAGSVFAYYGGPDSLEETAGWSKASNQGYAHYSHSVASAGDVNADGYADIIVGAPEWDDGQAAEGGAWVYLGSATGLESAPDWYKQSDQAGAYFGWSVGKAGDVNGDGYDDVIVGTPYYDFPEENEGLAGVYLGSRFGVESAPAWYKDSDQEDANFGYAVGTAGDVNGDGYSDVIVGAPMWTDGQTNEGGAWVYHGWDGGVHTAPDWYAQSNSTGAQFGTSLGTAGDINCDGSSDVIIGAPMWNNGQTSEGGAWVYLGSFTGLLDTYRWRQDSDNATANYGMSVGTAGDVNGDGYSDIIVGAPNWDGGQENEGKAYVYHSSGDSLYLDPAWSKESDQAGARFGWSVGTAGDVNGDGYADIIVGAYLWTAGDNYEGGAWVYHGSDAGVHVVPDWHAEGGQTSAHFGASVGTAGDVNGDAYADVIVGAPWYDKVYDQEGQAFIFHGNDGKGVAVGLTQMTFMGPMLAHLGRLITPHYSLGMFYSMPFGRGGTAHENETKPLGTVFDGQDTFIPGGRWSDTIPGSGTTMLGEVNLPRAMSYHWRTRILYSPATTPFLPASRWMTIPWNGWNEADFRSDGRIFLPMVVR